MEPLAASRTVPEESRELKSLHEALMHLDLKMKDAVASRRLLIDKLHPSQKMSAENLIHYLSLRSEDIRTVQDRLHVCGLSSLASSESHVRRQLQAIMQRLGTRIPSDEISPYDYEAAKKLIKHRSEQLFGTKDDPEVPHLMITFDNEFGNDYQLVKRLLQAGMNIARINCAHDSKDVWQNMVELVKTASEKTGIPCKIYMDLAGPKIRTTILGKGKVKGKTTIFVEEEFTLAEQDANYDPSTVVIGCDEPGVVRQVKVGDRVLFDEGLIEAKILSKHNGLATLKIIRISSRKPHIKAEKGINLPDTRLSLPALTEYDKQALPFICENADLVGYSFVRHASDVIELQEAISAQAKKPLIILKIETPEAVKNFPALLMQGMHQEFFGVMIARGDLAVEIGFERMSEIQEEILWISEAAHVPVVWATQVLETLNKSGIATRSEITDASHACMAECVMINKGEHILKVIETLRDILQRSGGHHVKKRYTFRPMQIASRYLML
ncbi:MAG: pyruvate kinase [Chitinophagales bacterium]